MLSRLLTRFKPRQKKLTPALTPEEAQRLREAVKITSEPVVPSKPKARGRVIKQTMHAEFNPDPVRHGGRIVKVMPPKLQKIKAAQEKVEDDNQPRIEDIED